MEQQNQKPSIDEVKDALKTISKYCSKTEYCSETDLKDCERGCEIYKLLGGCPTGIFMDVPEDWKID